jgi:tetratricopeptide (TPR) repeat protein
MPQFPRMFGVLLALGTSLSAQAAELESPQTTPATALEQPLQNARRLLREGHYEEAVAAAQSYVTETPADGAGYMVMGLACYRSTRYQDALQAFGKARNADRPPSSALLSFNEGSAYFALHRFSEAQRAFSQAAADDPSLALLATANAGHAAIGAGDIAKARTYAMALEKIPHDSSSTSTITELTDAINAAEVDEADGAITTHRRNAKAALSDDQPDMAAAEYLAALEKAERVGAGPDVRSELWYAVGYARYRGAHYKEAEQAFTAASKLAPNDGEFAYMLALCTYRMGQLDLAHTRFALALKLGVDEETSKLARNYLASTDWGMNARGEGLSAHAGVTSGYDSNVSQLGGISEVLGGEVQETRSGTFTSINADAQWGSNVGDAGYFRADYYFDQLAYTDTANDAFSLQVHSAALRSQYKLKQVFLGLAFLGDYQLSGLSNITPFLMTGTLEPSLVVPESAYTSTNLRFRIQKKSALDESYEQFSGRRFDLRLTQKARWKSLRTEFSYGHRRERIGTRAVDLGTLPPRPGMPADPILLRTLQYSAPYSYNANGVYFSSSLRLTSDLRMSLDASYEHFRYVDKNKLDQVSSVDPALQPQRQTTFTKELGATRRSDNRLAFGAGVSYSIGQWVEAGLRYDGIINDSTIDYSFDNKNFTKHQFMVELGIDY